MNVIFYGAQRPAIDHLAGRWSDSARCNVRDCFGGVIDRIENRKQSFHVSGKRVSFTVISVTSASVPSDPTKRPIRS